MKKSLFEISKMDCPSEENLIRMKLDGPEIKNLEFDIPNRKLTVFHMGKTEIIESSILDLNLGGKHLTTCEVEDLKFTNDTNQRQFLWIVFSLNFIFFIIEMAFGLISKSMGLVADSLDMLADSFVYAISLSAVGSTVSKKKKIASTAGWFQILLATIGFGEVIRRFFFVPQVPEFSTMIIVSLFALAVNSLCLYLLQKSKSSEAHMQASMIFTSNDIIINTGVIVAGILVYWTNSQFPDLIIGTVVFILVIKGALRILSLGK